MNLFQSEWMCVSSNTKFVYEDGGGSRKAFTIAVICGNAADTALPPVQFTMRKMLIHYGENEVLIVHNINTVAKTGLQKIFLYIGSKTYLLWKQPKCHDHFFF